VGSRIAARVNILCAAALFSTGGALIKGTSFGAWQVAAFRSGVAALALVLLLPAARRGWSWRAVLVGIAYASTVLLFVHANKRTTSANAIFLQSTAPLFLLVLSPWLLRERLRPRDVLFMVALAVGMALVFTGGDAPQATAPAPALGNAMAAASALTWALTIVGLRWLARGDAGPAGGAAAAAVAGNALAFGVGLGWALPVATPSLADVATVAFLGVFQIGLAYALLMRGVHRVPAFEASLLLLVEPALNPLWTWLAHGESPSLGSLAGAAVILTATALHARAAPPAAANPDSPPASLPGTPAPK
jgi:drug/metabolite transporter (DMT)-like permease